MYRSSSTKYIRSENPVYRWGFLVTSTSKVIRRFKMMERLGVCQSYLLMQGITNQPLRAIAPPKGDCHA